eukprot:Skav232590  [mRNA]  locus=scaffold2040:52236:55776:+ [translate_table: standard]
MHSSSSHSVSVDPPSRRSASKLVCWTNKRLEFVAIAFLFAFAFCCLDANLSPTQQGLRVLLRIRLLPCPRPHNGARKHASKDLCDGRGVGDHAAGTHHFGHTVGGW